jgi:hypothetical protein
MGAGAGQKRLVLNPDGLNRELDRAGLMRAPKRHHCPWCSVRLSCGWCGSDWRGICSCLPQSLVPALQKHRLAVRQQHRNDRAATWGRVLMPNVLAKTRWRRRAGQEGCQSQPGVGGPWVDPQRNRWRERDKGPGHLHHPGVAGSQGRQENADRDPWPESPIS